jgi:GTP cyclohydrolase I
MEIANKIRARLIEAGVAFHANDNISTYLQEGELIALEKEVEEVIMNLLETLIINTKKDHNTQDTARRIAKMMFHETYKGRYLSRPEMTDFPNAKNFDGIYMVGPIDIRSTCSHHFVPIIGKAWVGIIPSDRVIGLSKFSRLAEWIMARPQIQEEAAMQLANEIESFIKPRALAIVLKAEHMCMTWRGVRENETIMTTVVTRGLFCKDSAARAEILKMIGLTSDCQIV